MTSSSGARICMKDSEEDRPVPPAAPRAPPSAAVWGGGAEDALMFTPPSRWDQTVSCSELGGGGDLWEGK